MQDLLTPLATDWDRYQDTQSELGKLMRATYQDDLDRIVSSGRIPNWIELETYVQQDDRRLLDLIDATAGYVMGDPVTVTYGDNVTGLLSVPVVRHVDSLTHDAGFDSPGNCKATINRCMAAGWIVKGVDISGAIRYDLTERGRWCLDLVENDAWFNEEVE